MSTSIEWDFDCNLSQLKELIQGESIAYRLEKYCDGVVPMCFLNAR